MNKKRKSTIASLRSLPRCWIWKYEITIGGKFAPVLSFKGTESVEKMWDGVKTAFNETSATLLGKKNKKRDPWISKEVIKLSEERSIVKQDKLDANTHRLRPIRVASKTQTRDPLNFGPCKADWPAAFVIK